MSNNSDICYPFPILHEPKVKLPVWTTRFFSKFRPLVNPRNFPHGAVLHKYSHPSHTACITLQRYGCLRGMYLDLSWSTLLVITVRSFSSQAD